jgi:hypothetical protein
VLLLLPHACCQMIGFAAAIAAAAAAVACMLLST